MDTVLATLIVLAAAAGIARSAYRRLVRRTGASCSSGCEGCALAARCGAAAAGGASPTAEAPLPPQPGGSTVSPRRIGER